MTIDQSDSSPIVNFVTSNSHSLLGNGIYTCCVIFQTPPPPGVPPPPSRAELIMLKSTYYAMLHCFINLPIMPHKYAQIMLIKCDPHSKNQPSGQFQACLGGVYFHNFSMLVDIGPLPSRFDDKEFPLHIT